jgi:hypothetical protein
MSLAGTKRSEPDITADIDEIYRDHLSYLNHELKRTREYNSTDKNKRCQEILDQIDFISRAESRNKASKPEKPPIRVLCAFLLSRSEGHAEKIFYMCYMEDRYIRHRYSGDLSTGTMHFLSGLKTPYEKLSTGETNAQFSQRIATVFKDAGLEVAAMPQITFN